MNNARDGSGNSSSQSPTDPGSDDPCGAPWAAPETPLGELHARAFADASRGAGADAAEWLRVESESLVQWAGDTAWLLDPDDFARLTAPLKKLEGGREHHVWTHATDHGLRALKMTKPPNFGARGQVLSYVQNALWCNHLFGDDIRLEGVLHVKGATSIVISQPFILGRSPTAAEIEGWFQRQGYVEKLKGYLWEHPITGARIGDTHAGNFIMTDSGVLMPIDLQVLAVGR